MTAELELKIGFAAAGNSLGYLGGGWARAEPEFTWSIDTESHIILPRVKEADEFVLTLDVVPFVHVAELPSQRLIVSINDTVIGSSALSRPSLLGYRIPGELARRSERLLITLQHPDAARPIDFDAGPDERSLAFSVADVKLYRVIRDEGAAAGRLPAGLMLSGGGTRGFGARAHQDLGQWVTSRTELDLPRLAMSFESLGENCEFGLVQRRCDAEPLGLLRFSSTYLRGLIRGLDTGFEGLGEPDDIEPKLEGDAQKEYMIHEKKYGLIYHTFVYEGQRSLRLMREQEITRLKFLRRKFMEELEVAEKIFVYKRNAPVSEEEILPLLMALRRHGGNTLLWVVPAEKDRPPGTVELAMPGLLKGYIDRFAPDENAHDFSFDGWMKVCANAWLLARLRKGEA